jgi:hypothetical protein
VVGACGVCGSSERYLSSLVLVSLRGYFPLTPPPMVYIASGCRFICAIKNNGRNAEMPKKKEKLSCRGEKRKIVGRDVEQWSHAEADRVQSVERMRRRCGKPFGNFMVAG